jgi:hypothetical protein
MEDVEHNHLSGAETYGSPENKNETTSFILNISVEAGGDRYGP